MTNLNSHQRRAYVLLRLRVGDPLAAAVGDQRFSIVAAAAPSR
jgi:hypothetical protein